MFGLSHVLHISTFVIAKYGSGSVLHVASIFLAEILLESILLQGVGAYLKEERVPLISIGRYSSRNVVWGGVSRISANVI